jgi:replicative DNA helicase
MLDAKILNWMMQGSSNLNDVYREVQPDLLRSIFLSKYKASFISIDDYYSRHKIPPSYTVLKKILINEGEDPDILDFVEDKECQGNEVGFYLDEIKQRYNKFLIAKLAEKAEEIEENDEGLEDFNDELKKTISKTERLYKSDVFTQGDITDSVGQRIDNYLYTKENPDEIKGFLSGYQEIDDYTWGVKDSEMLVIAGASSSGKSMLMQCMAVNAWLGSNVPSEGIVGHNDGKDVLMITLEMSKKQYEARVDANVAKVRHRGIVRAQLSAEEKLRWDSCLEFQKNYDKKFYILDMPRGTTMGEIEAKYETLLGEFTPDAVFIDYLQLMKPTVGQKGQDWLDVGHVSEELHEFCRKKNKPVVTAAQRKTAQKKSGGKRIDDVNLEDLGRSKMIGDNAAIVMIIANREDEHLREDMEIHLVKNRDGAKGKVLLRKDFARSRIEALPDNWTESFGEENEL